MENAAIEVTTRGAVDAVQGRFGDFPIDSCAAAAITSARMDGGQILLTAAAGAAVGEVVLGQRLGNRAMLWGGGLALGPSVLDGSAGLLLNTAPQLAFAGAATHSLMAVALAAWLLPRWLGPRWQRSKIPRQRVVGFSALVWLVGPLLACLTIPGVQFLWPFPAPRLCADLLAPGDAMPGLLLGAWMLATAWIRGKKKAIIAKRRRFWWWGIGCGAGYLVLLLACKLWATTGFGADLARRGAPGIPVCASPTAWNPLLWRGLARQQDALWLAHRSIWEGPSAPVPWTILPRQSSAFTHHAGTSQARRMAAASGDWWICRTDTTGLWLADLRAGTRHEWGLRQGMVDLRCLRSWHFQPGVNGDPVRFLRPDTARAPGTFRRYALRSFARRDAFTGSPRLAGVPGSLPEILATSE